MAGTYKIYFIVDLGSVWERGSTCVPKKFEIVFFVFAKI
jgi:hypothetical protein